MFTLWREGVPPVQSAPRVCILPARSRRNFSPVRRYSHTTMSSPSPQRYETQLELKAPAPWAFMKLRKRVTNGTTRRSREYSS